MKYQRGEYVTANTKTNHLLPLTNNQTWLFSYDLETITSLVCIIPPSGTNGVAPPVIFLAILIITGDGNYTTELSPLDYYMSNDTNHGGHDGAD